MKKKLIQLFPTFFLIRKARKDFYETNETNLGKENLDEVLWYAQYGYIINRYITLLMVLVILLSLCRCAKQSQEPEQPQQVQPTVVASKYVEIFITYGSVNGYASVKWSYDPEIDSSYASNNSYNRTIKNNTISDSIIVFTNSGAMVNDNVMVFVNGVIKQQYTASQTAKVIKLN